MTKFVGTKQACEFFDVKKPTLDRWCVEGRLPFYKFGGKRMFDLAELEKLVRETAA